MSTTHERAVLWAILTTGEVFSDVAGRLTEEHFTDATHRAMWSAMTRIAARRAAIDETSLALELADEIKRLDAEALLVGHPFPDPEAIDDYVSNVQRAYRARIARDAMREAIVRGLDDETIFATSKRLGDIASEAAPSNDCVSIGDAMPGYLADLDRLRREKARRGSAYGIGALDGQTGGMMPGDLVVVAGRPGDGKTAFAITVADSIATKGGHAVIFSLEMSRGELLGRLLSSRASLNGRMFRDPRNLGERDFETARSAAGGLAEMPLTIRDTRASIRDIETTCRRLRRQGPLGVVVVDYLDLIDTPRDDRRKDRHDLEIGAKTSALKKLAKELGCPIVLLVQLNRAGATGRPMLIHLKNSGSIEQDADTVLLLHREDSDATSDEREIIIAKQRGGRTGSVVVRFRAEYTRFEDVAETRAPVPPSYVDTESANTMDAGRGYA